MHLLHRHVRSSSTTQYGTPTTLASSNMRGIYVNDEERTVLTTMRTFRQPQSPNIWKRIGCTIPTILMALFGLMIGFLMGFDQASAHSGTPKQTIFLREELLPYSSISTPLEQLGLVRKTRNTLIQKIREEYGDYANVLMDVSSLQRVFQLSDGSKSRYQRRLIQKILTKQLHPKQTVSFTWITAGDVRAAGYGNDPGHSYTSMLDDTAKSAFSAIGLSLVAQNHGIYNFPSGPALALCLPSFYGPDIDILSWDFALTDGDFRYRAALFAMRAVTLHPTRPLLLLMDSSAKDHRWKEFRWAENSMGVGLMQDDGLHDLVQQHLPDSARLSHPEQLPPALQYLQCHGTMEGRCGNSRNDRTAKCTVEEGQQCRDNKFLVGDSCDMTKYQADWNPGWKYHRLKGRLLGLFLIQLIQDALLELDEATKAVIHMPLLERRETLLKRYQQLDAQDQFIMRNSAVSSNVLGRYADGMSELTIPLFQREAKCVFPPTLHAVEPGGGPTINGSTRLRHRRLQEQITVGADPAAGAVLVPEEERPFNGTQQQQQPEMQAPLPLTDGQTPGKEADTQVTIEVSEEQVPTTDLEVKMNDQISEGTVLSQETPKEEVPAQGAEAKYSDQASEAQVQSPQEVEQNSVQISIEESTAQVLNAQVESNSTAEPIREIDVNDQEIYQAVQQPSEEKTELSCPLLAFTQKDVIAEIKADADEFVVDIDSDSDAFLVVCFRTCTFGNCVKPLEGLDSVKITSGNIVIEVDNLPVIGSREIDFCHFLEGDSGYLWKAKNDRFRIKFRVKEEGGNLLLHSVLGL